jgi:hypothetical protein
MVDAKNTAGEINFMQSKRGTSERKTDVVNGVVFRWMKKTRGRKLA